jgi:fused signal recognition particle receptor
MWAQRTGVEVVAHKPGADPGAVVYDALDAAIARKIDTLIIDTAGRLHTKTNLMDELSKIRRVIDRRLPGATPETLFVLDATTGQNGLAQARAFNDAVGLTGIVLTKLDSTARGGIVFAIGETVGVPVRYVGVGERAMDLLPFDPKAFVEAMFG